MAYAGLPPAQIALGRALVACPQWRWRTGMVGVNQRGGVVEVMAGRPLVMDGGEQAELLPLLSDPGVLGHLMTALAAACGGQVSWTCGQRSGPDGERFWCRLEAGPHTREWEGACQGEAVAGALSARWIAMARSQPAPRPHARPMARA